MKRTLIGTLIATAVLAAGLAPSPSSAEPKAPPHDVRGPEGRGPEGHGPEGRGPGGPDGPGREMERLSPEEREKIQSLMTLARAYHTKAEFARDKKKPEEAVVWLRKILDLPVPENAPKDAKIGATHHKVELTCQIAEILTQSGKAAEALADIDKAMAIKDLDEAQRGRLAMARAMALRKSGDLEGADKSLDSVIEALEKKVK